MNAKSFLVEIARLLEDLHFDAVLIGNAAAALQGAPVTTVDFDFLFRKTPRNLRKLKDLARSSYGLRSFAGVRARATLIQIDAVPIRVASLADIIKSKRPPGGPATSLCWTFWRRLVNKRSSRRKRLAAVTRESERGLIEQIRRWQALPPERRTHFLRKRVTFRGTAL